MKKLRRGAALFAVLVFMLTALVPTAFAEDSTVTPQADDPSPNNPKTWKIGTGADAPSAWNESGYLVVTPGTAGVTITIGTTGNALDTGTTPKATVLGNSSEAVQSGIEITNDRLGIVIPANTPIGVYSLTFSSENTGGGGEGDEDSKGTESGRVAGPTNATILVVRGTVAIEPSSPTVEVDKTVNLTATLANGSNTSTAASQTVTWKWAVSEGSTNIISILTGTDAPTGSTCTVTGKTAGATKGVVTAMPQITITSGGNTSTYDMASENAQANVTVTEETLPTPDTVKDASEWTVKGATTDQNYNGSYWPLLPTGTGAITLTVGGTGDSADMTVSPSTTSITRKGGEVTIQPTTPVGVYTLTIPDGSSGNVTGVIVVQGTASISPSSNVSIMQDATNATLTATLAPRNGWMAPATSSITWDWKGALSSAESSGTPATCNPTFDTDGSASCTVSATTSTTPAPNTITATPSTTVGNTAYPLAGGVAVTVNVKKYEPPKLDDADTWLPSNADDIVDHGETSSGDQYAILAPVQTGSAPRISIGATGMQISTINDAAPESNPPFKINKAGALEVLTVTPGVYTIRLTSTTTQARTDATIVIVIQGTASNPTSTGDVYPNADISLQASMDPVPIGTVQWQWTVDPATAATVIEGNGTPNAKVHVLAASGQFTVSAMPYANVDGKDVALASNPGSKTIEVSSLPNGILIYDDTDTLVPSNTAIEVAGHQYKFVANTTQKPEEGTTWTYTWKVTPNPATSMGTAPTLSQVTTAPNTALCFPTSANVGTWTVSVTIAGADDVPTISPRTISIVGSIETGASITQYSPVDLQQWVGENVPITFSITGASGGTNAQGAVPYTIVWYGGGTGSDNQYTGTGTSVSPTPFPTGSGDTPYTLTAAAIPNDKNITTLNAFNDYVKDHPDAAVSWTINKSNPNPAFSGGNALVVEPYNGTVNPADAGTSTPQTVFLQLGGSATFKKSLVPENKPSTLFTFNWQTATSGSDRWTTVSTTTGFAGFGAEQFTTPLMTLDMDGRRYRLQVSNAQNPSSTITSQEVVLSVNRNELISPSTSVIIASTSPRYTAMEGVYNVTVPQGQSVTMTTQAQLPPGVQATYQWQRAEAPETGQQPNWQNISGETNAQYVLKNAAESDNGDLFRCGMSVNYANQPTTYTGQQVSLNVTSATSYVTINSITANGEATDLAVYSPSEELELEVKATATGETLEYQWYYATNQDLVSSGNPVPENGNAARYVVTNPDPDVPYYYWCDVNGVLSNSIEVVYPRGSTKPQIIDQSAAEINASPNTSVTLAIDASVVSRDPLHYTWEIQYPGSSAWTVLDVPDQRTLAVSAQVNLNGAKYRCTVSNTSVTPPEVADVKPEWTLYVFSADSYVTITGPQDYVVAEPLLRNQSVQATVQVGATQDLSKYQYEWEYSATQDGTYAPLTTPGVSSMPDLSLADLGASLSSGSQTFTVQVPLYLKDSKDKQPNEAGNYPQFSSNCYYYQKPGYYRLRVTNTTVGNNGEHPTNLSRAAYILIQENGQPYITEQPQNQVVAQGASATFTVNSRMNTGTPVYRWQKWVYTSPVANVPDYGNTETPPSSTSPTSSGWTGYWANCDATDGTGINSASFTTAPTTAEDRIASMQNEPIYYRCLVYNYNTGLMAPSDAALLTVTTAAPVTPALVPVDGTKLSIVTSGNAKYLQGTALEATTNGTTVQELIDDMQPFRNYTIRIMSGTGSSAVVVQPTSRVCTGFVMELLDRNSTVVDSATIVVRGDVLGRGCMQLSQLVTMANVYKGSQTLTGAFLMAGKLVSPSTTNGLTLSDLVAEAQMYRRYPPLVQS